MHYRFTGVILLAAFYAGLSFAPVIRIAYRPSLTIPEVVNYINRYREGARHWPEMAAAMKAGDSGRNANLLWETLRNDPRSWGHVSLGLPTQNGESHYLGWNPVPADKLPEGHPMRGKPEGEYFAWLYQKNPMRTGFNVTPGTFADDTAWFNDDSYPPSGRVQIIDVEVSDAQLSLVRRRIAEMKRRGSFQLSPIAASERFSEEAYNCVSAQSNVLRELDLSVPEYPQRGMFKTFVMNADAFLGRSRFSCVPRILSLAGAEQ